VGFQSIFLQRSFNNGGQHVMPPATLRGRAGLQRPFQGVPHYCKDPFSISAQIPWRVQTPIQPVRSNQGLKAPHKRFSPLNYGLCRSGGIRTRTCPVKWKYVHRQSPGYFNRYFRQDDRVPRMTEKFFKSIIYIHHPVNLVRKNRDGTMAKFVGTEILFFISCRPGSIHVGDKIC
jgi:hypothetical protein